MEREPVWRRYLRFWRADVAADVDDELRFHLDGRVADLVARGLTPAAALAQTHAEFGDVEAVRVRLREIGTRRERRLYVTQQQRDGSSSTRAPVSYLEFLDLQAAALLASLAPAWRAARVDPVDALRDE